MWHFFDVYCIFIKKKNLLEHENPWQNQIVSRKNKPTIETKRSDFQKQETVRTSVRTTLAYNIELINLPFPLSEMELYRDVCWNSFSEFCYFRLSDHHEELFWQRGPDLSAQ